MYAQWTGGMKIGVIVEGVGDDDPDIHSFTPIRSDDATGSDGAPGDTAGRQFDALDATVATLHIRGLRAIRVVDNAVATRLVEHRDLALGVRRAVCRILALVVGGPEQGTLQQTGVRGKVGQTGDVYAAALPYSLTASCT